MKNYKILILYSILLSLFNCSKESDAKTCEPLKAVEFIINNPKDKYLKTDIGYYEIIKEDNEYIYFGFWRLNQNFARIQNPIYKTNKNEYNSILNKISNIDIQKAENLTEKWFLNKYPEFKNDSIAMEQNIELKFIKNKISNKYDTNIKGYFEFNVPKRKKSYISGIDSINTKEKLKNFNFEGIIVDGDKITTMNVY